MVHGLNLRKLRTQKQTFRIMQIRKYTKQSCTLAIWIKADMK
jgi:hypothetical protein